MALQHQVFSDMWKYEEAIKAIKSRDFTQIDRILSSIRNLDLNRVCSNGTTLIHECVETNDLYVLKHVLERFYQSLPVGMAKMSLFNTGDYYVMGSNYTNDDFGDDSTPEGMEDLQWDMELNIGTVDPIPSNECSDTSYCYCEGVQVPVTYVSSYSKRSIGSLDEMGQNALTYAVRRGNTAMVEYLLNKFRKDIDINMRDIDECSPLYLAVEYSDHAMMKLLLENGAIPNAGPHEKYCPLQTAIYNDDGAAIKLLADYGANMNDYNSCYQIPLVDASCHNRLNAVIALLEKGANVNAENFFGDTSLRVATVNNYSKIVKLLLQHGARIFESHHLLHQCARVPDRLEMMCTLFAGGAKLDVRNDLGHTPLMEACTHENFSGAEMLLRAGASANAPNWINGLTPLHICAKTITKRKLAERFVDLLVGYGADTNKNSVCGTPLLYALGLKNKAVARSLIRQGVKITNDTICMDIVTLASNSKDWEVISLLVFAGFKMSWRISYKSEISKIMEKMLSERKIYPLSLKELCRISIRKSLKTNIVHKAHQLPLPNPLMDYLTFDGE